MNLVKLTGFESIYAIDDFQRNMQNYSEKVLLNTKNIIKSY